MLDVSRWPWLTEPFFIGITPINLSLAVLAAIIAYLVMSTLLGVLLNRLAALQAGHGESAGTPTGMGDGRASAGLLREVLAGTSRGLMLVVAVLIGVGLLDLPQPWASRVSHLWFVAMALQFALWANRAVSVGLRRHAARHGIGPTATGTTPITVAATLISWGLRTLLWSVVLLAMLSNLGVNITAFVASLGVGGIAIALAAQNILGDLFASVAIAVDKPFEVGDAIAFGAMSGSVEHVGIKTTRLRSPDGEQIVIGNTDLLKQTIRNFKRMQQRRVAFTFHLAYGGTPEQLAQVPAIVKAAIVDGPQLAFDRAHLLGFVEQGVKYEVVYNVTTANYGVHMDEQQRIQLRLMQELTELGLAFAQPVRIVQMAADGDGERA